jgi:DNA polymerase III gamma/tau subunit
MFLNSLLLIYRRNLLYKMDLINDITNKWITAFIKRPQATVLIQSLGDRNQAILVANHLFTTLRTSTTAQLYRVDLGDKKSIGIDDVRDLQKYLKLKTDESSSYSRFILLPDADKLTTEAQNSLLKLLEEIPKNTIVMLVARNSDSLLPTVSSRCFSIQILPISLSNAKEYGKESGHDEPEINKAYSLSEGRASIFKELLRSKNDSLDIVITLSKEFLQKSVFDRQEVIKKVYSDGIEINEFLRSLRLMATIGMRTSKSTKVKLNWKQILQRIVIAQDQVQMNAQPKLALLALSVSI